MNFLLDVLGACLLGVAAAAAGYGIFQIVASIRRLVRRG